MRDLTFSFIRMADTTFRAPISFPKRLDVWLWHLFVRFFFLPQSSGYWIFLDFFSFLKVFHGMWIPAVDPSNQCWKSTLLIPTWESHIPSGSSYWPDHPWYSPSPFRVNQARIPITTHPISMAWILCSSLSRFTFGPIDCFHFMKDSWSFCNRYPTRI